MKRNKKNTNRNLFLAGSALAIVLVLVVMLAPTINKMRNGSGQSNTDANGIPKTDNTPDKNSSGPPVPPTNNEGNPTKASPQGNALVNAVKKLTEPIKGPVIKLQEVVIAAKTWMPVKDHSQWFGKAAPDFSVMDIDGKRHTLKGLKGKHLLIVLWAHWYSPSLGEITKLTELRNSQGQDELAILGISFDDETQVRNYVNKKAINFPMVSAKDQDMPAPYSLGKALPGAFFITPDGILKISTQGPIPSEEILKILQSE